MLPLVPVVIAAGFQHSRLGPLFLTIGLTLSFTLIGVSVTAFGHLVGIDSDLINRTAAVVMVLFGVVLLLPRAQAVLATVTSPLASDANARLDRLQGSGVQAQFMVGLLLGAVWSPCIGPTLGGAVSLAATGEGLGEAALTMLVFGVGISSVLLALAYGSRKVLNARRERLMAMMPWAKPIMGITLLVVGAGIFFHIDRMLEGWFLDNMPIWLQNLSVAV